MIALRADGAGRKNVEHRSGQARLLRGDGRALGAIPGGKHEPRNARCVLTQPRLLRAASALACGGGSAASTTGVYGNGLRITCVDRAIMRAYFHPYEPGLAAQDRTRLDSGNRVAGDENPDARFLPSELESKLTRLPTGYYRVLRGNDVCLVRAATHEIVDSARGISAG